MSLNSLITQKIKQSLNETTKNVIDVISDKYNVSKEKLSSIWNNVNKDFKIKSLVEGKDVEAQTIVENGNVYIIPSIVVDNPVKIIFEDEENEKEVIKIVFEDDVENELNLNF